MRTKLAEDTGQAAALVVISLLGLLALTALVIDGGVLFSARRNIQSLADAAARAGAMATDETKLRESGGEKVELDPEAAEKAAADYLEGSGFKGEAEISADTTSANVRLAESHPTVLLGLVGIRAFDTGALALAHPRTSGR